MTKYAPYIELPQEISRVEACWQVTVVTDGNYVVLPDGRMDFVIAFEADAEGVASNLRMAVTGPSSRPVSIPVRAGDVYFGIRFRPGFGACLGVAPSQITNSALRGPAAVQALGDDASQLGGGNRTEMLREAVQSLAGRLATRAVPVTPACLAAIDRMHASGGRESVASLAHDLGVPERTLRRHMHDAVGLTPKTFASVLRFQRTMRLLRDAPDEPLAAIAAEGGYSDQAHLTREFRLHGGFTPGQRPPVTLVTMPLAD